MEQSELDQIPFECVLLFDYSFVLGESLLDDKVDRERAGVGCRASDGGSLPTPQRDEETGSGRVRPPTAPQRMMHAQRRLWVCLILCKRPLSFIMTPRTLPGARA